MKQELEKALTRIERRISSLYFDGDFTKAIDDELASVFDTVGCLRLHPPDSKISSYFLPERDKETLLREEKRKTRSKPNTDLFSKAKQFQKQLISKSAISDIEINIKAVKFNVNLRSIIETQSTVQSLMYIPLVVRACTLSGENQGKQRICSIFSEKGTAKHYCPFPGKQYCKKVLKGVVKFYSRKPERELKKTIGRLGMAENTFLGKINKTFSIQDEPDCYRTPGREENEVCRECPVRESCWMGYKKGGIVENLEIDLTKSDLTKRLDPDKVISQLFEKCKAILPKEVKAKIAFLQYRADLGMFQYRALKYMEVSKEKLESLKGKDKKLFCEIQKDPPKEILHPIEDITKDIFDTFSGDFIPGIPIKIDGKVYVKDKRLVDRFSEVKRLERIIFDYDFFVAMPVFYLGQLLGFIFANFEPPGLPIAKESPTFSSDEFKAPLARLALCKAVSIDLKNNSIKNNQDQAIAWLNKLLCDPGLYNRIIENKKDLNSIKVLKIIDWIKRAEYYFPKHKIFRTKKHKLINRYIIEELYPEAPITKKVFLSGWGWEDFRHFKNLFFNIGVEFGPLLYNSLIFDFISKIVSYYAGEVRVQVDNDNRGSLVHEAVISNLPAVLNVNMIGFWAENKEQASGSPEKIIFRERPDLLLRFKTRGKKYNDYKLDLYKKKPLNANIELFSGCYSSNIPVVKSIKPNKDFIFPAAYASKNNFKSALMIPLKDNNLAEQGLKQGIYILFFEHLSTYILQRNALDIAREISGIFKVVLMGEKGRSEVLRHATKAASNAIISRNFSHHVGSHVVPRATVEKIIKKIGEFCPDLNVATVMDPQGVKILRLAESVQRIINTLKTRLDEYNQKKSDFMAEIATESLSTTKTMFFYRDIIVPFLKNTLLIGNLCASEGLRYVSVNELRIIINCSFIGEKKSPSKLGAKFECSNCKLAIKMERYPYIAHCTNAKKGCYLVPEGVLDYGMTTSGEDKPIAVPGPLGEFALFSFLENFIRNAAKHNSAKWGGGTKKLHIHIDLSEIVEADWQTNSELYKMGDENEFYKVEIYDNVTDPCKRNGDEPAKLYEFINDQIRKPIVNPDGTIRKGSWGISEMKIMANLLSGSDERETMARNIKVNANDSKLKYEFKVMKAKKIAFIGENQKTKEALEQFNKFGVWFYKDFDHYWELTHSGRSIASFDIAIVDEAEFKTLSKYIKDDKIDYYERILAILPFRTVVIQSPEEELPEDVIPGCAFAHKGAIELSKPLECIASAWKTWIQYIVKRHQQNSCLAIYLEQKENEVPTSLYINKERVTKEGVTKEGAFHVIRGDNDLSCDHSGHILFDRHFHAVQKVDKSKLLFHEAVDKNSADFTHLFSPLLQEGAIDDEMVWRLFEAGMLKILVIDERIAEKAGDILRWSDVVTPTDVYGGTERVLVSKWARIYICTHLSLFDGNPIRIHPAVKNWPKVEVRFNLNKDDLRSNLNQDTKIVYSKTGNGPDEEVNNIDVLIIHQGILEHEELVGVSQDKFGLILSALREKIPYVLVDSGRGIPHKLHKNVKFLPFSLLDDYVGKERIAKYSLTKVIMSLSRRKTNGADINSDPKLGGNGNNKGISS